MRALFTDQVAGLLGLEYQRQGESGIILLQGAQSDDDTRKELIERSMRGEQIELLMHARTYGQGARFTCSRPLMFSEAGMDAWVKRAPDTPLQFDHSHADSDCGGRCLNAEFKHLGGDSYELIEGILLNTPRSVQSALRGNMRKFSLGIDATATDTVLCSHCDKPYLDCDHYAGEVIDDEMVRLVYTDPIPMERSAVTYPAVLETGVLGWQQLSAMFPNKHTTREEPMSLSAIAAALQLDSGADESAVLQKITQLRGANIEMTAKVETLSSDLAKAIAQVTSLSEKLSTLAADQASADLDRTIAALKADARITDGQEVIIRDLFQAGHVDQAVRLAASFADGPQVAPVGVRQSLQGDDARTGQPATTTAAASDLDWHALAKELPAHIRQLGGATLAADPRAFIEANKDTTWVKNLSIDWDTTSPRKA